MENKKFTIGIDEVGRGPVAGPVAVGMLAVHEDNFSKVTEMFVGFKDSKKLTPKRRNEWFENIKSAKEDGLLEYRVVFVDNKEIDKNGIAPSIRACIHKSLEGKNPDECSVLLDGGLKAPDEFVQQTTIIRGDENEMVIALASIVAKVTRDAFMCKLAKDYPEYGFENHKGYGTKAHMEAVREYGLSDIHRKSFLTKIF